MNIDDVAVRNISCRYNEVADLRRCKSGFPCHQRTIRLVYLIFNFTINLVGQVYRVAIEYAIYQRI